MRPAFKIFPLLVLWTGLLPLPASHAQTTITEEGWILSPNPTYTGYFGWRLDLSGDWALGVAPGEAPNGAVHVFHRDPGSGSTWVPQATLIPDLPAPDYDTVRSVVIDGDRIAVGYPGYAGTFGRQGAVLIYTRSGGSWSLDEIVTAADPGQHDQLGYSVDLEGDRLVAGAPYNQLGGIKRGTAYVFEHDGQSFVQKKRLLASDGGDTDRFGESISLSGDRVLVGAPRNGNQRGKAYCYLKVPGAWVEEAKFHPPEIGYGSLFGSSCALQGDQAIVSAPGDEYYGYGAAFIFERIAGAWVRTAYFQTDSSDGLLNYGSSVDIDGSLAVVGAPHDSTLAYKHGSVWVYEYGSSGWALLEKVYPSPPDFLALGESVRIEGERLLAGATQYPNSLRYGAVLSLHVQRKPDATAFCFGDGSSGSCPCSNGSPPGSGEGCTNSTGIGALLEAHGSARLSLDDLSLHAAQLPPGRFSILFAGTASRHPGLSFGDGLLCVVGSLRRFAIQQVGSNGSLSWGPGLAETGGWNPGDTRYFQCWHRDGDGAPCGSGHNVSAALELSFLP